MDPAVTASGCHLIDIKLVKEQLRLLGHSVEDAVILAFLDGLGATTAGINVSRDDNDTETTHLVENYDTCPERVNSSYSATPSNSIKDASPHKPASPAVVLSAGMPPHNMVLPDAAPTSCEPDQQSPSQKQTAQHDTQPPNTTLDQRCRKYLARQSQHPSLQQHVHEHEQSQSVRAESHHSSISASKHNTVLHAATNVSDCDSHCTLDTHNGPAGDLNLDGIHGVVMEKPVGMPEQQEQWNTATASSQVASRVSTTTSGHLLAAHSPSEGIDGALSCPPLCSHSNDQLQQPPALHCAPGHQTCDLSSTDRSHQAAAGSSAADIDSQINCTAQGAENQDLPRFGFRPGYKPAGIHIPSLLSPESLGLTRHTKHHPAAQGQQQPDTIHISATDLQHSHVMHTVDDQVCSKGTAEEVATGTSNHGKERGGRLSTRDSSNSSSDPLFNVLMPSRVAQTTILQAVNTVRPPVKVAMRGITTAAECSVAVPTARMAADKGVSQAVPLPVPATSSNRSLQSCSSNRALLNRNVSITSSTLSAQALYCQQLSLSGRHRRITAVAPGVQKTDRVARFQQMQRQWQKDRFLSGGATGCSGSGAGSSSSSSIRGNVLRGDRVALDRAVVCRRTNVS